MTETVYQYSYSFVINKYAIASFYVNKSQAIVPVISQFSCLKSAMSVPKTSLCYMFDVWKKFFHGKLMVHENEITEA